MRRYAAELIGTALLLATVVGSGIMGDHLAGGNVAVALLANALATGAGLVVYISALGPISGAHFNPAVTLVTAWRGALDRRHVVPFVAAQVVGGVLGVLLAHAMFGLPLLQVSAHARADAGLWVSEIVATFARNGVPLDVLIIDMDWHDSYPRGVPDVPPGVQVEPWTGFTVWNATLPEPAALLRWLKARGVRFEICEITLKNRNLNKAQFSMDAEFTPSGVVRVGRLQAREGYGYIKP